MSIIITLDSWLKIVLFLELYDLENKIGKKFS
jgi:hypothetical protein